MRTHRILVALFAAALSLPVAASAQQAVIIPAQAGRGMLGFHSQTVDGAAMHQRVVVEVIAESPAARAGLVKGDTLLRINGLAASPQVMGAPFEPGDTVVLRVRRDGRERDLTVVAGERPQQYRYAMSDSVNRQFSIYMDRLRSTVDSVRGLPGITMRRFESDSGTVIIIGGDTVRIATPRSIRIHTDSLRIISGDLPQVFSDVARFRALPDSTVLRMFRDSTVWRSSSDPNRYRMFTEDGRMFADSMAMHFYTPGEGRVFSFGGDSAMVRGFDVLAASTAFGVRAVAGAELATLNPALSEYFGATDGVLVINAADRTPAERAGLRGGDVIVRVGDTAVRTIAEVRRAIERAPAGDVTLRVLRRGRTIDVTLPR